MSDALDQSCIPGDTSRDAFRAEVEALRHLGIEGRARLTFDLIEQLRTTTEAGVRDRHPEYTPEQVRMARNRIWWGDARCSGASTPARILRREHLSERLDLLLSQLDLNK